MGSTGKTLITLAHTNLGKAALPPEVYRKLVCINVLDRHHEAVVVWCFRISRNRSSEDSYELINHIFECLPLL